MFFVFISKHKGALHVPERALSRVEATIVASASEASRGEAGERGEGTGGLHRWAQL